MHKNATLTTRKNRTFSAKDNCCLYRTCAYNHCNPLNVVIGMVIATIIEFQLHQKPLLSLPLAVDVTHTTTNGANRQGVFRPNFYGPLRSLTDFEWIVLRRQNTLKDIATLRQFKIRTKVKPIGCDGHASYHSWIAKFIWFGLVWAIRATKSLAASGKINNVSKRSEWNHEIIENFVSAEAAERMFFAERRIAALTAVIFRSIRVFVLPLASV